ncbi:MAG: hypothetical protein IJJ33_19220 [Victivallales bacterium]|nr:hypothetical protein [Victivallales bacterium]
MNDLLNMFAMTERESCQAPEDNGLVNGRIAVNSWLPDVAEIRGLFAPPLFSNNFRLAMRVNDRQIATAHYEWRPDRLTRIGSQSGLHVHTELTPLSQTSAMLLRTEVTNLARKSTTFHLQHEVYGGVNQQEHWRFGHPTANCHADKEWDGKTLYLRNAQGEIQVSSSLPLTAYRPVRTGVLNSREIILKPGEHLAFWTFLSLGKVGEHDQLRKESLKHPEEQVGQTHVWWQSRVKWLFAQMPSLASDNRQLVAYYRRSLLHLLMNEWNVPGFLLHPHYGTGSISGDTICSYMWNYGGPYRLWSMLSPQSAREHLLHLLGLDLANCYAFHADDGTAFGPYYPINHEKVIFLAYYYVLQTGDSGILRKKIQGKSVIEHLVEHALAHDNPAKKVGLVNYGPANDHLELRSPTFNEDPTMRYNGVMPDLNLRRCPLMHLVAILCRLAGHRPTVDLEKRAETLKRLIHRKLFSSEEDWFQCLNTEGPPVFRYTIQMFKALGWGDWALEPEAEQALLKHLMADGEFLGPFGMHSLSRKDPAYYEGDVDNGGPGACVSFAAAVIERLYRDGYAEQAANILQRLLWMGDALPYWGDSQRADVKDYRRISHLQCDIEGAVPAQAIIFGMFGIDVRPDFSITISPHLFPDTRKMALRNIRLAGRTFDILCTPSGFSVKHTGKEQHFAHGETCTLTSTI